MTASSRSLGQPFGVSVTADRAGAIVALTGELDIVSADVLEREVKALRLARFDQIVVDLRHVEFVDSTGLRVLLGLRDHARREGHKLILIRGTREAQLIFEVTGTEMLFEWRS